MENNRSAMYAQASRSNGWTQVEPAPKQAVPAMPDMPVTPGASAASMPKPPVVVLPEAAATGCQTLVMAYVPAQQWREVYEAEQGLSRGTIFAELDLPFVGEGACKHE